MVKSLRNTLIALCAALTLNTVLAQQPITDQLPKDAKFDARITIDLPPGLDLETYITELAGTVGLQPVVEGIPQRAVNYPFENVKFRDVWNVILAVNNLEYQLIGNVVVIAPSQTMAQYKALTASKTSPIPTVAERTRVNLDYSEGKPLEEVIRDLTKLAKLQVVVENLPRRNVTYNLKGLILRDAWNIVIGLSGLDGYAITSDVLLIAPKDYVARLRPAPAEPTTKTTETAPPISGAPKTELEAFVDALKLEFVGASSGAITKGYFRSSRGLLSVEQGTELFKDAKVVLRSVSSTEAVLVMGDKTITLKLQKR
jgi:hypothetical protein